MDILLKCPHCNQKMSVDEKFAGKTGRCPACSAEISVPLLSTDNTGSSTQANILSGAMPSSSASNASNDPSEPNITRRSGWADLLKVIGMISLLVGVVGGVLFVSAMTENYVWDRWSKAGPALALFICGIGFSLHLFFSAFLIDVFTDIRWFLKKLSEKKDGTSQ